MVFVVNLSLLKFFTYAGSWPYKDEGTQYEAIVGAHSHIKSVVSVCRHGIILKLIVY